MATGKKTVYSSRDLRRNNPGVTRVWINVERGKAALNAAFTEYLRQGI
jgi:hypothetical protein